MNTFLAFLHVVFVDVLYSDLKKSGNVSLSLHGAQLVMINTNLDIRSWVLSMFEKMPLP